MPAGEMVCFISYAIISLMLLKKAAALFESDLVFENMLLKPA